MKITTFILIFFVCKTIAQIDLGCPHGTFFIRHLGFEPRSDKSTDKAIAKCVQAVGHDRNIAKRRIRERYPADAAGDASAAAEAQRIVDNQLRRSTHTVYVFPYDKPTFDAHHQFARNRPNGPRCLMTTRQNHTPREPTKFECNLLARFQDSSKKNSWNCVSRGIARALPAHSTENGHYEI